MARGVAAVVILTAVTAAAEPRELDARARHHLERGVKAFEEGRYAEAARAFETGHGIDPHPVFYFPWAEAVRRSGDCAKAVPLYQKALETAKTEESRRLVRRPLAECERIVARGEERLEEEPAAESPPLNEPEPRPPPPAATPPAPARRPPPPAATPPARGKAPPAQRPGTARSFYLDPVGDTLAGAAVISLAIAVVSFGSAASHEQAGRVAPRYDPDAKREYAAADRARLIGVVAISAAGGAGLAAALRWWALSAEEDLPAVSAWIDGHGAVVGLGGAF